MKRDVLMQSLGMVMKRAVSVSAGLFVIPAWVLAQPLPTMPPTGYDQGGLYPAGTVTAVSYYSPSQGANDTMYVYTPPGYNPSQKYPVVYGYPGIGAGADTIFAGWCVDAGGLADNLIGQGKIQPVILVAIDDNNGDVQADTLNVIIP
jgi:enterochelin esterase-like enzyme